MSPTSATAEDTRTRGVWMLGIHQIVESDQGSFEKRKNLKSLSEKNHWTPVEADLFYGFLIFYPFFIFEYLQVC